ncbi:PIR Superfamily Protein [Plasmodium ovale curtisi]|uniref:PIR Superfamily Protein n=1 Tax=Plasmodium ovale curtisi TaxID=864141 RepID=A0A1A8WMG3_PLAOA|nr:PIR Superfamily Protein [Plasmodium ovale curtisi]
MDLSLDQLAKKEVYKVNLEYVKLFDKLDNVCTAKDEGYDCETFNYTDIQESFIPLLNKIFNILKRTNKQNDIYINGKSLGNFKPCIYYKYWFYHKVIKHISINNEIKKLNKTWNNNLTNIYNTIFDDRCKFHAKSLDDVKILKVLYDYILFFNITEHKHNLMQEIKNCEFCKLFKTYLGNTFNNRQVTCNTGSPYALCMEHNEFLNLYFDFNQLFSLTCQYNFETSNSNKCQQLYEKLVEINSPASATVDAVPEDEDSASPHTVIIDNSQGNNSHKQSVITGISILGLSFTLLFLYKFTSIGSFIRLRTGRITNIWKGTQEEKEVLLLRDSETENINFDNTQYNIAYNPV